MIRDYDRIRDEKPVMALWLESTTQGHPFLPEEYWRSHSEEVRTRYLPLARTVVDQRDGRIVAFMSVLNGNWIGALFVAPDWQGKGVGSRLMEHAQHLYNELGLEVYSENENAKRFYRRHGFALREAAPAPDNGHILCKMIWTKR